MNRFDFIKKILMALMAVGLMAGLAPAAANAANTEEAVLKPIHQFIDASNKGDNATAAKTFAASPVLVDEFAPYIWRSATAFADWGASYEAYFNAKGASEPHLVIEKPRHVNISESGAYVVIPTIFHFKVKGAEVKEAGIMTFVMGKENNAWKITQMTWTTR